MFKKQKEEFKNLVEDGKVAAILTLSVVCLSIGYILGASTTAGLYQAVQKTK